MAKRDSTLILAFEQISSNRQWEQIYSPYLKIDSRKGNWLNGSCPLSSHGGKDKNPSFGVNLTEGTYNCFVCGGGDAMDFLMDAGHMSYDSARAHLIKIAGITEKKKTLTEEEKKNGYFKKKKVKGKTFNYVTSYIYTKDSIPIYRKNRYERLDGPGQNEKSFDIWQYSNGSWKPSAKNVKRVLYKNENIQKSIENNQPIFICEGEKDVDTLTKYGYYAVTAGGVNEWQACFAKELIGADNIIIPDNDIPGIKAAERIAADLFALNIKSRIVNWSKVTLTTGGFPDGVKNNHGEDVTDLINYLYKKLKEPIEQAIACTVDILINESDDFQLVEKTLDDMDLVYDFETNDTGNALRLIKLHGKDIRFCPEWNCWLHYIGYWSQDVEGHIFSKVRDMLTALKSKAMETGDKDLFKFVRSSGNYSKQKSMLEVAKNFVEHNIPVTARYWDGNDELICLKNCTINTKLNSPNAPFEIQDHRRKEYITKQLEFDYDPTAKSPLWEKFLTEILIDKDVISFLQRATGYSLTGDTSEDGIFILYGSGQNGKSTLVDVLAQMLGEYANTISPDTLMHKEKTNTPNTEIARIRGTRLVRTSESDEGKRISESTIKALTSGEPVSARFLYGHDFEYKPTYKIWFSTNHKPLIRGSDNGIWRRIYLIPFEVTITADKKDGRLCEKLSQEIPGIFNWALEGLKQWKLQGLNPPEKVQMAVDEYRKEQDILMGFIDECVRPSHNHNVVAGRLFDRYLKYCEVNNLYKLSSTAFGRKMVEKGYTKSKIGSNIFYHDIELVQPEDNNFVPIDDKDCPFI